ncbi:MAG TPA: hypothetical protein VFU05_07585 [Cyclobacteriaceae bacterium]|nr:hypothetical protein [Cyclobacteriaceae bacterium]
MKKDKDGVKVYTCKSDTSKFRSLKAEFSIKGVPISELKTFLFTVPKYLKWQYKVIESNLVKYINDNEMIYRVVIDAPWPLDNREMIVHFKAYIQNQNEANFYINTLPSDFPRNEDLIRVPYSQASWAITRSNNTLQVIYKMNIDPGGYVPPLLVNIAMADGPHQSFRNLKKLIEKK